MRFYYVLKTRPVWKGPKTSPRLCTNVCTKKYINIVTTFANSSFKILNFFHFLLSYNFGVLEECKSLLNTTLKQSIDGSIFALSVAMSPEIWEDFQKTPVEGSLLEIFPFNQLGWLMKLSQFLPSGDAYLPGAVKTSHWERFIPKAWWAGGKILLSMVCIRSLFLW